MEFVTYKLCAAPFNRAIWPMAEYFARNNFPSIVEKRLAKANPMGKVEGERPIGLRRSDLKYTIN